jgi:hypothetical protein
MNQLVPEKYSEIGQWDPYFPELGAACLCPSHGPRALCLGVMQHVPYWQGTLVLLGHQLLLGGDKVATGHTYNAITV